MVSELREVWVMRQSDGEIATITTKDPSGSATRRHTVERLTLLTPEAKAVIEAAEYVCDDYDEAEVNSLPTPMRHLWNAVTALHAAKAGGASDGR